jgi:hypothetical protein
MDPEWDRKCSGWGLNGRALAQEERGTKCNEFGRSANNSK